MECVGLWKGKVQRFKPGVCNVTDYSEYNTFVYCICLIMGRIHVFYLFNQIHSSIHIQEVRLRCFNRLISQYTISFKLGKTKVLLLVMLANLFTLLQNRELNLVVTEKPSTVGIMHLLCWRYPAFQPFLHPSCQLHHINLSLPCD